MEAEVVPFNKALKNCTASRDFAIRYRIAREILSVIIVVGLNRSCSAVEHFCEAMRTFIMAGLSPGIDFANTDLWIPKIYGEIPVTCSWQSESIIKTKSYVYTKQSP